MDQQHMEAESGGAEDSGPIAAAHCVQPAVSIALVLPQPAPQPQDHHREQVSYHIGLLFLIFISSIFFEY